MRGDRVFSVLHCCFAFAMMQLFKALLGLAIIAHLVQGYEVWYSVCDNGPLRRREIRVRTCVALGSIDIGICSIDSRSMTGCRTYIDPTCNYQGFSQDGSILCG